MKTFRWKVKPGMDVASVPSVRKVRFGDGYSQRAPAGLNANLKTYSVTLSVSEFHHGRSRRINSHSSNGQNGPPLMRKAGG